MLINDRLEELGMTKYRLSRLSGVAHTTINDICHERVSVDKCAAGTLYKIATVLGVTVEDILMSTHTADEDYRAVIIKNTGKNYATAEFMIELNKKSR